MQQRGRWRARSSRRQRATAIDLQSPQPRVRRGAQVVDGRVGARASRPSNSRQCTADRPSRLAAIAAHSTAANRVWTHAASSSALATAAARAC